VIVSFCFIRVNITFKMIILLIFLLKKQN